MRKLSVSTGSSRYDKTGFRVGVVSWPNLVSRLSKPRVWAGTLEEYSGLDSTDKLAAKDHGWWVGGRFSPAQRRKANLKSRSVLTLDLDHLDLFDDQAVIEHLAGVECVLHSSQSHTVDAPRLRLVCPLTRDVSQMEYEAIGRHLAGMVGIDLFDSTGFQPSRVMFWPGVCSNGEFFFHHGRGDWLDPDAVLSEYEDWTDFAAWPRQESEGPPRDPSKVAADPYDKPGIIGAFNRAFSVPDAIEIFGLPYVPSGGGDGRYSFTGGTSADGAIYYEEDGHLYSWHESDPARGNHSAWDLVRIHQFGELDAGEEHLPVHHLPSQQTMAKLAYDLPEAMSELTAEEFEPVSVPDDERSDGWMPETPEKDVEGVEGASGAEWEPVEDPVGGGVGEDDGNRNGLGDWLFGGGDGDDGEPEEDGEYKKRLARSLSVEQEWLERIEKEDNPDRLKIELAEGIRSDTRLTSPVSRETLIQAWRERLCALTGVKVGVAAAREALTAVKRMGAVPKPDWMKGWVYVSQEDAFFHLRSKKVLTGQAFNRSLAADMLETAAELGLPEQMSPVVFATTYADIPQVDRLLYVPSMGDVFAMDGFRYANLYDKRRVPTELPSLSEEHCDEAGREAVQVVADHFQWLLSDEREQRLLLDWLAWQVQRPGVLVRWAPLICGHEGDGKTAWPGCWGSVMGSRNVRPVSPQHLGSGFTSWAHGAAVVVFEEVMTPGKNRHEVVNALKEKITNDEVDIHPKGKDPYAALNTTNYLMLTNHEDAIPLEAGTRRYFSLMTRFEDARHLAEEIAAWEADHGQAYFDRLYDAIREHPKALRRWLLDHEFSDEFLKARTAPHTQQRDIMVDLSISDEERMAEDLIEEGNTDYVRKDILSIRFLTEALSARGLKVRGRTMNKLLQKMGWRPLSHLWGGKHRDDCRVKTCGTPHRVWIPIKRRKEWPVDPEECKQKAKGLLRRYGPAGSFDEQSD